MSKGSLTTYLGSANTLGDQAIFVSVFDPNPVILRASKRKTGTCAIEDTEYLATKLTNYCDLYQLHLFCSIVKLQFIGTKTYDMHRMLHDIYLVLSGLKFVSKVDGNTISLIPNTLYQNFIKLTPLLPSNTTSWSLSLVSLFYNALGVELQEIPSGLPGTFYPTI